MKPKISIITITYNSEKTLDETIKSVVSQNYENLEYLIIDGGSTDNTLKIVEHYRDQLAFVISEPDRGISDAFNKGIRYATGDIIGIINSDDLLLPGALKELANSYEEGVDVYRGNVILWDEDKNTKLSTKPTMEFPLYAFIKSVCHQATFVTKSAYDRWGGFKLDFRYMMDADLLHRLYIKGARFKHIDKDMAVFRLGGVTSDNWKNKIGEVMQVVIVNGGSKCLAQWMCFKFAIRERAKKLAYNLLGETFTRKLRYK